MILIYMIFAVFIFITVLKLLKTHAIPWKYIFLGALAFVAVELIDYPSLFIATQFHFEYNVGNIANGIFKALVS